MRWQNTIVLITGASSGIGEATARALATQGAELVLVARRAPELERVAGELRELTGARESNRAGERVHTIAADITVAEDREQIRTTVQKRCGRLDVLVNNAGITAHGRFDASDPAVLRRACEVNFFAAVELTSALLPLLKLARPPAQRSAAKIRKSIALVSTPSGLYGVPGRFAYSASKAAGHAWMETMRSELHADEIDAVIFCPGYARTALRTSGLAADGSQLQEEQSKHAKEPAWMAAKLRRALEAGRQRVVLTGFQGSIVYWLRTLAPGLLEWLMRKKLGRDMKKTL